MDFEPSAGGPGPVGAGPALSCGGVFVASGEPAGSGAATLSRGWSEPSNRQR